MRRAPVALTLTALLALAGLSGAASPPPLLHYQGVLRDAAGEPLDATVTMELRFLDVPAGGAVILVNQPPPVTVSGGLFGVELGSGSVLDGPGPGAYLSLAEVFRDFESVYLEVVVDGEVLAPRTRILAAGYALNAGTLDGRDASEYLNTSAAFQTKSGDLGVDDLTVGGRITIAGGAPAPGRVLTSDGAGLASWEDPAVSAAEAGLGDLAARLKTGDPTSLPFAEPGYFDCSGGSTATLAFSLDGVGTGDVVGFVGRDAISRPFEYLVSLESTTDIPTTAQIGKAGRITVQRASGTTTYSGTVTEFGLAAVDGTLRTYVARLEPALSDLGRSVDYGLRQEETLTDTLDAVLNDAGVTNYAYDLNGTYPPAPMTVQYQESDLAFVTRLTERDGVHFHFREGATAEQMVVGDHGGAFPAVPGSFAYYGDMQDPGTGEEFVATFHSRDRRFTATGTVRAYDFQNPALVIDQSATEPGGVGERYEFYASGVDGAKASTLAQQIVDRDQVRRLERTGTSNAPGFRAGHAFTLTDGTVAGFGGTYLVTEVTHFALRDPDPACIGYGNVFTAIPSTTTYRPPRVTPRPVVKGPMTAEVTGPPGSDTYTDGEGRIKVQFHWDRDGAKDENSSGWIRVATPAGRTDDPLWLPRVGTEVVVDFLQGDPDRPVVVGSVENGTVAPPSTEPLLLDGSEIRLNADGPQENQSIYFYDAGSPTNEFLRWDEAQDRFDLSNDLEVSADLTVTGNDIFFGGGGRLSGSTSTTFQAQGNANTDDIFLLPGNSTDDGALRIFGDGTFEMRSGSGLFTFVSGASGVETGRIDAGGNLQVDGDVTVSGGDVIFGSGGIIQSLSAATTLVAGNADLDDLILRAGNSSDDGEIAINGDSTMVLQSGNGIYSLDAGDTVYQMGINQTGASLNEWKLTGANLDLYLGDSGADNVFVPGDFTVSGVKNFAQNHPHREDLSVVYTALEGDEVGTYTRGSAELVDGVARVALGETFALVTSPDLGLTAHVTPRGVWADLYVESVTTTELVVRGRDGADASFDYIVHGLRVGYEDFAVLQPRRLNATVPTLASYDRFYDAHPELRAQSAGARFGATSATGTLAAATRDGALALRRAIGEHDPDVDGTDERSDLHHDGVDRTPVAPVPDEPAVAVPAAGADLAVAAAGLAGGDDGGDARARSFRSEDPELATLVPVSDDVEPGDLLVVDPHQPDSLRPSYRESDPSVVGIVSGRPGVLLGGAAGEEGDGEDAVHASVAFSGIVAANVDAGYGAIRVGDLLTSSPTPGHAMRSLEPLPGTIVGKALEPLDSGTGAIRVLVMPR